MKNILNTLVLAAAMGLGSVATADVDSDVEFLDEARQQNTYGFWECRAQAPRLIRVFKAKGQGYRDDIQDEALKACNAAAVFQCWPLGCAEVR